ncbi:MAG: type I restriction endonuclease subunit R, partial [Flavobacteriales bacterium]
MNGIYLGYSELKSNFMGQRAASNGRSKVVKDYFEAVRAYYEHFERNALLNEAERTARRRDLLKVFERAIHITATDVGETYVLRNLPDFFDEMLGLCREGRFDRQYIEQKVLKEFKP